ncbi:MAG: PP2C family protein-serine/threonine phosphatase [Phycisphaerales bacterium]|nr:PP2C family protein-serine/threonine phosphatase [Phycisphaerales bacterium]
MHKQTRQLVGAILDFDTSHLVENLNEAEIRRNTAQFLGLLALLGIVIIVMQSMQVQQLDFAFAIVGIAWACFYLAAAAVVYFGKPNKIWCIRISLFIIIVEGFIAIVRWIVYNDPSPNGDTIIGVLIGLTLGALLLPWTPRQTLMLSGIWVFGAISSLFLTDHPKSFSILASVFAYIAVTVPGIMISFFRTTRLQDQFELHFLQNKYEIVREELQAAKNIHERAFPKPKSSGQIRFTYSYRPMSQIGGDSIFASIQNPGEAKSPLTLILYDVTGHGLSAALTANRLQGELMRILGEEPAVDPSELLKKLDRYVCLTLADSAVLVTAVAINADPERGTIRIANAGHPAAILRKSRGSIQIFESTAPVLGIGMGFEVEPTIEEEPFTSGDSLIAYTDGVSEAVLHNGELYSTQGVVKVLEGDWIEQSERWPEKILTDVEKQRAGSASDDILIVELYCA